MVMAKKRDFIRSFEWLEKQDTETKINFRLQGLCRKLAEEELSIDNRTHQSLVVILPKNNSVSYYLAFM